MPETTVEPKELFINRDLSWLAFNERVLEESVDPQNPLMERVKFLAICANNLDEFYMVRLAGIKNLISSGINKADKYGYYPQELADAIRQSTDQFIKRSYNIWENTIQKELTAKEILIKSYKNLKTEQKRFVNEYFASVLFPIITPLAVDPSHPFPILPSKTLAFAIQLERKGQLHQVILPVPQNIPRLVKLPGGKNETSFILIDDILRDNVKAFFSGYKVLSLALFRLVRDSELPVEEEYTPDFLKTIEDDVRKRSVARTVHLEIEKTASEDLLKMLCEGLKFDQREVCRIDSKLDLTFLFELAAAIDLPELYYPGFVAGEMEYENIFDRIKQGDFILHLPYQSFQPTIDLISAAAHDENVLAIKMTLYRTSRSSAVVGALKEAVANKKQVTVMVEIRARFDEETNIKWVRELEESGCHVIYGLTGLKVHSKMTLVVRREEGAIQRYVHLSTGNYNEKTARGYSDIGYFTANEDVARDISDVFNVITGYSMPTSFRRVVSAPEDLRKYFFNLIDREIEFQKKNKNGLIRGKMNSLEDPEIITKLYEASAAGVKIRLVVRGICCLIPGQKGLSENISVKSIVGRFLEHSRIFLFNNNGSPRYFLSSADWMTRNFDRRIELLFEIVTDKIKEHLKDILDLSWKDTVKARELQADRTYKRSSSSTEQINFQEHFIGHYKR